ncbi:hypothetical protein DY926_04935 [Komagataeibacter melaceti]|uniref:Uncharacterized protein n=1 Tax=Komagataeibacter melaceti TaxID=2766577 RepID=A0A371Z2E2_9PROT|nr:hypothetical protein DY926_04935 [Komagataeibacter melaceti]
MPFGEGVGTAGTDTTGPVIRTNHASVQVQYVSNAQPIDNWRQQVREAFTWALAAEIAIAVTGCGEIAAQMRSMAAQARDSRPCRLIRCWNSIAQNMCPTGSGCAACPRCVMNGAPSGR